MWALRGVQYEPDRLKENQRFVAQRGVNFQRILGHVDWAGNAIDWRWALTEDVLGHFLDYSWGEFGLRSSVTLLGSAVPDDDAQELCWRVADIISRRPHAVQQVGCANEANVNHISMSTLTLMAHTLRSAGYAGLLSLTAAEEIYSGVSWADVRNGALLGAGVDLLVGHPDRGQADDGCRFIRQPYDYRDLHTVIDCEEPIGPLSSVAQSSDPLQLAMLRAVGLCHGMYSFVIHNAAGVFGQVDPMHGRPANLWEVPGIEPVMQAIRNVEKVMPANVGAGRHWNNEAENPFRVTHIWPEDGHGANRRYCVEYPWGFICPTFGITEQYDEHGAVVAGADYVCRDACTIEAFDPVRGEVVRTETVPAGVAVRLAPSSLDYAGHGGLIVRGTFL